MLSCYYIFIIHRGAELIEELRQKQMNMQEETESKILDKIKIKMERIKANQKKIQGVLAKHHERHHDAGTFIVCKDALLNETYIDRYKLKIPKY